MLRSRPPPTGPPLLSVSLPHSLSRTPSPPHSRPLPGSRPLRLAAPAVRMLTIHRYFNVSKARKELGYEPLHSFHDGWAQTLAWFKANWAAAHRSTEEIRALGWS
mmetsp:Transcript_88417/g.235138  ORF Transcript_88417/g.235138 Transcript_88417/m.235138 type:complete len:105 (-) Transcript_88417:65-379(-)